MPVETSNGISAEVICPFEISVLSRPTRPHSILDAFRKRPGSLFGFTESEQPFFKIYKELLCCAPPFSLREVDSLPPSTLRHRFQATSPPSVTARLMTTISCFLLFDLLMVMATVAAFPAYGQLSQQGATEMLDSHLSKRQEPVANVTGLLRVPDNDHPFIPPGPTDQRGPCPGLNA